MYRPTQDALTVSQVATMLGVSHDTAGRIIDDGVIAGAFCTLKRYRKAPRESVIAYRNGIAA